MSTPPEEAGRNSASQFGAALSAQMARALDTASALAAERADEWGIAPGTGDGLAGPRFASRGDSTGGVRSDGGEGGDGGDAPDAPAYRGGGQAGASSNAQSWMRFAMSSREEGGLGLTRAQAAGVVGNLQRESGRDISPYGVTGDRGTAHGAAQWRHERFARLQSKAKEWGQDWRQTATQQRFMRWELDHTERAADAALRASKTPEEAASAFNRHYERSADPGAGRRGDARRIFNQGEASQAPAQSSSGRPTGDPGKLQASPGRHPDLTHVDPRLREIMAAAGSHLPPGYTVGVNEGYNAHGHAPHSQHHVAGRGALDVQIFDPQGRPIPNRGRDTTGLYRRLGRAAYGEMQARYPELTGRLAHGASFGTRPGGRTPDLMHFDLGGERGDLAPHLSELGALPGEKYGVTKKTATGGD